MDNPLLAALQSNYGDGKTPPPDPSTVRGLLEFCRLWLDRETETDELHNPCMEMAGRLRAGAKAQGDELRQNPDLGNTMRDPLKRQMEAYITIAGVLDKLPVLAAEEDVDGFEDAIELFEDERQVVLDCNSEIEEIISGKFRVCPRCGDSGEGDLCESCHLIRLYPDPRTADYDRTKTAILPPIYGTANELFDSVMSGKSSLPVLLHGLSPLEDYLQDLRANYQQAIDYSSPGDEDDPQFRDGKELAQRVLTSVDKALAGIERIHSVSESFRMADLSRGWDGIFDAAVEIKRGHERYARENGFLEGIQEESDTISFDGV